MGAITWPSGPRRAVGNVSGNRCESDCRSRGRELDPGPVPYFRGDYEIILRAFSSLPHNHSRRIVVSYKRRYVHEVLVNCLFKLAQEKSVVRWTDRPAMTIAVDLGCKATKQTKQTITWQCYIQIGVIMRCVIKGLHCSLFFYMPLENKIIKKNTNNIKFSR